MNFLSSKLNFPQLSKRKLFFAVLFLVISSSFIFCIGKSNAQEPGDPSALPTLDQAKALFGDKVKQTKTWTFTDPTGGSSVTTNLYTSPDGTQYQETISTDTFGKQNRETKILSQQESQAATEAINSANKTWSEYIYDGLLLAFAWVCDFVLYLFSFLVALGGYLLDLALYITSAFGFTKSEIVKTGWTIIRDIANMFFSLVLLIIAFATILRIETYGMKQVLWKLVVAALLINFSLTIAGVIIDGSNVLTKFFLSTPTSSSGASLIGTTASASLLNSLQVTKYWKTDSETGNALGGASLVGGPGFSNVLINALLGIVIMVITAFVLFAAAILFYIRMVALWILLIFSPLAWLAMVLPATRSMWNKWWHEFFKWIIFAPVYAFFLHLALVVLQKKILINNPAIESAQMNLGTEWQSGIGGFIANQFFSNLSIITNYVVIIIFLLAGLIFARQSGIAGASAMINVGKAWRNAGGRMVSRWAAKGAPIIGMDKLSKWIGPQRWAQSESKFAQTMAKIFQAPTAAKKFITPFASPQVWSRYFAASRVRADNSAYGQVSGQMQDFFAGFGRLIKGGGEKIDEEKMKEDKIKAISQKIAAENMKKAGIDPSGADARTRKYYEDAARGQAEQQYEDERKKERQAIIQSMADQAAKNDGFSRGLADLSRPEISHYLANAEKDYEKWQAASKPPEFWAIKKQIARDMLAGTGLYAKLEKQKITQQRQAEFAQAFKDEDQAVNYFKMTKDPVEREALFRLIASINGLNTLFATFGKTFTPSNFKTYMKQAFAKGDAERIAADISAMAAANGNFSFVGTTTWDARNNQIRFTNDAEHFDIMLRKIREMEPQQFARQAHPDTFFINRLGKWDMGFHEFGERLMKALDVSFGNQMGQRAQGRMHLALDNNKIEVQNANATFYNTYTEKRFGKPP